jgi:hypothetical protein
MSTSSTSALAEEKRVSGVAAGAGSGRVRAGLAHHDNTTSAVRVSGPRQGRGRRLFLVDRLDGRALLTGDPQLFVRGQLR